LADLRLGIVEKMRLREGMLEEGDTIMGGKTYIQNRTCRMTLTRLVGSQG
jgi:hypothetical protein